MESPYQPPRGPYQQQPILMPPTPRRRYRLRFGWVVVAAIVMALIALISTVGMAFDWGDFLDLTGVSRREALTRVLILAGALVALTIVARGFRPR